MGTHNMNQSAHNNPWYVETFLAIGGWIAGLLGAAAIYSFSFLALWRSGISIATGALLIGGAFTLAGCAIGGYGKTYFARHLSIATIISGLTAATGGLAYSLYSILDSILDPIFSDDGTAAGLAGMATSGNLALVSYFIHRNVKDAILEFLLSLAVFVIFIGSIVILGGEKIGLQIGFLTSAIAIFVGVSSHTLEKQSRFSQNASAAILFGPLVYFLAISDNFLPSENVISPSAVFFSIRAILFIALFQGLWLLRKVVPVTIFSACLLLAVIAALFLADYGIAALAILVIGIAKGRRGLATIGVIAFAWSIGRYYYDLNLTLLTKSAIMAGMGLTTLAAALLLKPGAKARFSTNNADHPMTRDRRSKLAILVVFAALGTSLFLVNSSVYRLETAFADAKTIYLPLGPRDPRSLIQGDYMVLNFDRAIYPPSQAIHDLPRDGEVYLKQDEDGTITFSRIANKNDGPEANEIRIDYVKTGQRRLRYCPTTYFFQEGEAELYQEARFAVVLVTEEGMPRLIALADANRTIIAPQTNEADGALK